jgi:cob(I)alamin adenosyltransferase
VTQRDAIGRDVTEPGGSEPDPGERDPNGHDETGYDETGHDETGHDETGHDETGHGETGHDETVRGVTGHDMTERDATEAARHRAKMRARKAVQDAEVASKTLEKGLLMVHTGAGKGKSTAAFGLVLRMAGHGRRSAVVQFIKGAWSTGERTVLARLAPLVEWHSMGEGFTWETQDRARDVAAARRAWDLAVALMQAPDLGLLVLDELNIALRYELLPLDEVLGALAARPPALHVVVTGRHAKPELIAAADLVTEMVAKKHHFAAGVRAQPGIEF